MASRDFGTLKAGDAFQLDGKLYRKRGTYSAQLLRSASGHEPVMTIKRLILPETAVSCGANTISRCGSQHPHT